MDIRQYWEKVYARKPASRLSWYAEHLEHSLELLQRLGPGPGHGATVLDVGGGASTLTDDLLSAGYRVTVADVATRALTIAKQRLGERCTAVTWMNTDILKADFAGRLFDVWHDRALFHYLTTDEERANYVAQLKRATHPGSLVIMAVFSERGPSKVKGLPVQRFSPHALDSVLGYWFSPLSKEVVVHRTPKGTEQLFLYAAYRRLA